MSLSFGLTSCLSPVAMHRAVMEYDQTVSRLEAELLLLNIARARHHLASHFTSVTNVAATFDFRSNAGIGTQFFSNPTALAEQANLYTLSLGTSIAENPTVSHPNISNSGVFGAPTQWGIHY
ncbi:hypothetical protein [Nitrosococcus watsonii]|nr:hypothetical protein [Nitrosococcus watsonii]